MAQFLSLVVLFYSFLASVGAFPSVPRADGSTTPFDAAAQLVDVTGQYAFVPPGPGDLRGPCPALNAMANHGYLPHNGVITVQQATDAQVEVFSLGVDVATALGLLGVLLSGNLVSFSIGGPPPTSPLSLPLIQQYGISFSHNKYEGDASPTRGDLYIFKNDYKLQIEQFKEIYAMQPDTISDDVAQYTFDMYGEFRESRIQQSIANNPYFFAAPLPQLAVTTAAYALPPRVFANHSADNPDGFLNRASLKSFFAVTGDNSANLQYTPGYERIPNNWYRRHPKYPYDAAAFVADAASWFQQYPDFVKIGGNTGTTNSFAGIDLGDLTGGVFNTADLLNPTKAMCFAYRFAFLSLPDFAQSLIGNVLAVVGQIENSLISVFQNAGCPQLAAIDEGEFAKFPGWTQLKSDGTY